MKMTVAKLLESKGVTERQLLNDMKDLILTTDKRGETKVTFSDISRIPDRWTLRKKYKYGMLFVEAKLNRKDGTYYIDDVWIET